MGKQMIDIIKHGKVYNKISFKFWILSNDTEEHKK